MDGVPPPELYYDMSYSPKFSTFANLSPGNAYSSTSYSLCSFVFFPCYIGMAKIKTLDFPCFTFCPEEEKVGCETPSSLSSDSDIDQSTVKVEIDSKISLLDLYSGCGAMSTGLCHGAHLSGLKLQTVRYNCVLVVLRLCLLLLIISNFLLV